MSSPVGRKRPAPAKPVLLTEEEAVQLMLRAMADPQRYRILRILASSNCGPETSCVSLLENLGLSQPTLSHHMKELRLAGLVKQKRNGRTTRYYLNRSIVQRFCEELIDQLLQG